MHYHHRHDDPCDDDHNWPDATLALFATLNRMETTMTEVQNQQNQIAADVQLIGDALTSLAADLADLQSQLAAQVPASVDLSGLDAVAQKAKDLAASVTSAPAPAPTPEPTPAPVPAEPTPAPVDPNAPAPSDVPAPADVPVAPPVDPNAPIQPSI